MRRLFPPHPTSPVWIHLFRLVRGEIEVGSHRSCRHRLCVLLATGLVYPPRFALLKKGGRKKVSVRKIGRAHV